MRPSLPIDPLIPELLNSIGRTPNLVLEAPPGAGKTTRVPPALAARGAGQVLVLEPRRLAARLAARRVAAEMGEQVGETVGYQVRFEEVAGPRTRLMFVTEGILTRRLAGDPGLAGVDAVVLDEFHERRLDGDLALALLRRLQQTRRPELRLLVMSATLDAAPVAAFLGGCPALRSEGRQYPVDVRYTPVSPLTQAEQVRLALESLLREGLDGDVLVFLPGAAEIREAARACAQTAQRAGLLLLPLHGDLTPEEQDRAVAPAGRRKVILSTNVAESSVTIEGVTAVIDTGLARVASSSPWTGLPVLKVARISKASANQRAGRAGRTGPGRAIRLYPAEDFHRRPHHDPPEITRKELSEVTLAALAMGVPIGGIEWLDRPPEASVEAAIGLLRALGAVDAGGRLTPLGRKMAAYPMHPRLSRLVIEADRRGAGETGCVIAALLSAGARLPQRRATSGPSDLLAMAEAPLDPGVRRIRDQIRRVRRLERPQGADDEAVLPAVLTAFPDRVARRRSGDDLLLAGGGAAKLARDSVVLGEEWMEASDNEDAASGGAAGAMASAIRRNGLLDRSPTYSERRASNEPQEPSGVESRAR
jgi:ATP-dependent helicase HrpB